MAFYNIYVRDAEYARLIGDICLGQIQADSKEEAEIKAATSPKIDHRHIGAGYLAMVKDDSNGN